MAPTRHSRSRSKHRFASAVARDHLLHLICEPFLLALHIRGGVREIDEEEEDDDDDDDVLTASRSCVI